MRLSHKYIFLTACTFLGTGFVFLLFSLSENIVQYHNTFIRRFPQHLANPDKELDLQFNSYYFAGIDTSKIYLGNITAPFQVTQIDTLLQHKQKTKINLKEKNLPFQSPQIRVNAPYFYLFEGTVPYVFKGRTKNWTGYLQWTSGTYFSQIEPIDSNKLATRFLAPKTSENLLGTLNLETKTEGFGKKLLLKQLDGVFDTDGSLHYNNTLQRLVYVHRYRNEFVVADSNLSLQYRGNTIDTVTHAHLKFSKINDGTVKTFSEPPLIVNKTSATNGKYLFVHSALPGQYESMDMWKQASIIDVYDLTQKSYLASFYIYHDKGKSMRSFIVKGHYAYVLIGSKLIRYKLRNDIIKPYN